MIELGREGLPIDPVEEASEKNVEDRRWGVSPGGIGYSIRARRRVRGHFEKCDQVVDGEIGVEGREWNGVLDDLLCMGE